MDKVKAKCGACKKVTLIKEWKKADIKVINGVQKFVGGCPHCHGEFYDEVK